MPPGEICRGKYCIWQHVWAVGSGDKSCCLDLSSTENYGVSGKHMLSRLMQKRNQAHNAREIPCRGWFTSPRHTCAVFLDLTIQVDQLGDILFLSH